MNVKRLLALVLQSAAVGASAQTYDSLWKQAEQAMQNDLPQTVIEHVDAVMQKAQQEKNEAQLLRAFLMRTVWGIPNRPRFGTQLPDPHSARAAKRNQPR